jgi:hypothetical protein
MCVLCGLIVMYDDGGSVGSWPGRCVANGNGEHIEPGTSGAEQAKQIHAAWLRDPFVNAIAEPVP